MPKPYGKEYIKKLQSKPASSDRTDIINWLNYTGLVDNYIRKLEFTDVDPEIINDEIQECWLMICEIPQEKWDNLYMQGTTPIKAFISGLIFRQIHSNSSPVYKKYKQKFNKIKHISDKSWEVFDETNVMLPTDEQISIKETDDDIIKALIENNQTEKLINKLNGTEKKRKTKRPQQDTN